MFFTNSINLKSLAGLQIVLAILLFGRQNYSQEKKWVFLGTDERRTKALYVDPNTQKKPGGNLLVWEKMVWSDASHIIGLVEWDCRQKRSRVVQESLYNQYGELSKLSKNLDWNYTVDETLGAEVYKIVCRNDQKSTRSALAETSSKVSLAEIIVVAASLREFPSINGNVIREVPKKERLILTGNQPNGNWHQVVDQETQSKGWLHKSTFKIIKPGKSPRRRKSA